MTTIRQFSHIALALLAMTGRVTMLGISRWAGQGGSYRTVQRFFATTLPWANLFWLFFRTHLFRADDVYLLAGDETVVTKAGKHTPGLDRFFASLSRSQIRILTRCYVTRTIRWDFGKAHQKAVLLVQPTVPIQRRMTYLTKSVIY